jgi:hypothetical protein
MQREVENSSGGGSFIIVDTTVDYRKKTREHKGPAINVPC